MANENNESEVDLDFDSYVPALSVDCVILGYQNDQLHALVLKWKNSNDWSLPGGFVKKDEDIDRAALRELKNRTGLDISFLKQLHVFGGTQRRDLDFVNQKLNALEVDKTTKTWLQQRFISVAYLALVNPKSFTPIADSLSDSCEWKPLHEIPQLLFDHNEMIDYAKDYLAIQIKYLPIGLALLPEIFTMKTLQKLYEVVLDRALDRANFQKKMLKLGILIRHEKQMSGGAHKAPYLYSFNELKYHDFLEIGFGFV
jgi:8-oxo-dGTP diphosphatase